MASGPFYAGDNFIKIPIAQRTSLIASSFIFAFVFTTALSSQAQEMDVKASVSPPSVSQELKKHSTLSIFIGSAADSSLEKAVENYQPSIPSSRYYTWDKKSAILADSKKLPLGTVVNLIGHSWGADTAVAVTVECSRKINLLITIGSRANSTSPVSSSTPIKPPKRTTWQERTVRRMKAARSNVMTWINVDACPDKSERNYTDVIADIGGKWDDLAKPYADTFIRAYHRNHTDFRGMMNYPDDGGKNPKTMLLESMK